MTDALLETLKIIAINRPDLAVWVILIISVALRMSQIIRAIGCAISDVIKALKRDDDAK